MSFLFFYSILVFSRKLKYTLVETIDRIPFCAENSFICVCIAEKLYTFAYNTCPVIFFKKNLYCGRNTSHEIYRLNTFFSV